MKYKKRAVSVDENVLHSDDRENHIFITSAVVADCKKAFFRAVLIEMVLAFFKMELAASRRLYGSQGTHDARGGIFLIVRNPYPHNRYLPFLDFVTLYHASANLSTEIYFIIF